MNAASNHQVSIALTQGKQFRVGKQPEHAPIPPAILAYTIKVLPDDKLLQASPNVEPEPTINALYGNGGVDEGVVVLVGVIVGVAVLVGVTLGVLVTVGVTVLVGVTLGVFVWVGVILGVGSPGVLLGVGVGY